MASISRPMYGVMILLVAGAAVWSLSPTDDPAPSKSKPRATKSTRANLDEIPVEELSLKFDRPTGPVRNVFHPLVVVEKPIPVLPPTEETTAIPSKIADGESNWIFTGMAEVDGVKVALLENSSTKQSGLVKEGDYWRKSQLISISLDTVLFSAPDGSIQSITRFNPSAPPKVKPAIESGFRPYDLSGAIGTNVQIQKVSSPPLIGMAKSSPTSSKKTAKNP